MSTNHKIIGIVTLFSCVIWLSASYKDNPYQNLYRSTIESFIDEQNKGLIEFRKADLNSYNGRENLVRLIHLIRVQLKQVDFWLRYLHPVVYKKINGPLTIEWETEVFEKYEKPYKRIGAGLTLAELYLNNAFIERDSLCNLIDSSIVNSKVYLQDSITRLIDSPDHFYFANRLFLLNLAAIYTTGFECPDKQQLIPELSELLKGVSGIYSAFNASYSNYRLSEEYLELFDSMIKFVRAQSADGNSFNHFVFIRDFVNPLFTLNQMFIKLNRFRSVNLIDYSLNDHAISIFDKQLYRGQDIKGVYRPVKDTVMLNEIKSIGKLLFYDPLLSGNIKRSCASCHIPQQYFTDTSVSTSLQFNGTDRLERNTPSLINVEYNHLIMLDGKHINLSNQAKDVLTNPKELNNKGEEEILRKLLSCKLYKIELKKFAEKSSDSDLNLRHVTSAISMYYGSFGQYNSTFDEAMNHRTVLDSVSVDGFNIFMSKAQCATCHFAPVFNGVKPPYVSSEFEVLGVPDDRNFSRISQDKGRFLINPATQTLHAFRTGSIRNIMHTKPYMHNGIFQSLTELVDFYNVGGGLGNGIQVENQTLSKDSLHLTQYEKTALIKFMESLNESIPLEDPPTELPPSSNKKWNTRKVGGTY